MTATETPRRRATARGRGPTRATRRNVRTRQVLLWLAAVRVVLSVVAIPLAPVLYREHFVVLVLLRPTKEVLLAGGFLVRTHRVGLPALLVAAVPLLLVGVWHFFALGRLYAGEIRAHRLSGWVGRVLLPTRRIEALQQALRRKGTRLVFLGRLAAFPSTAVAAAAGSSRMPVRDFLRADALGGLASLVEVVGAGYVLGEAYQEASPWLTAAGVLVLGLALVLLGRYLRRGLTAQSAGT